MVSGIYESRQRVTLQIRILCVCVCVYNIEKRCLLISRNVVKRSKLTKHLINRE